MAIQPGIYRRYSPEQPGQCSQEHSARARSQEPKLSPKHLWNLTVPHPWPDLQPLGTTPLPESTSLEADTAV